MTDPKKTEIDFNNPDHKAWMGGFARGILAEVDPKVTYKRPAVASPFDNSQPELREIAQNLQIMFASAQVHGDEFVTGYTIKTGAIHRILGILALAGYPVRLPAQDKP